MDYNWLKQGEQPLFDDMLWSKPERKNQAGKLLIVGGHLHGFDQAALAYQNAVEAGAGEVKVVLPGKLKPVLGKSLSDAVFVSSTSSGTLAKDCLEELEEFAEWADAVLLIQTGDNSETSLLITNFIAQIDKPITITDEIIDNIKHDISSDLLRPPQLLVLTIGGLQKFFKAIGAERTVLHDMGLRPLSLALINESKLAGFSLVTAYESHLLVYAQGKVVTTARAKRPEMAALAAWSTVWWMWQPAKPLRALATAAFEF